MFTKSSLFVYAAIVVGQFQASTAIDYLGGWLPTPAKQQCVDICVNSKATPTCPTNDPDCLSKKQQPFDYDYLLLEQLFVPQFCRDLLTGTDSTISHQNVLPYPNGITCKPEVVKSEMTIHGLWPNYNAGYIGCCNVTESIGNHPYNALEFSKNQPTLLAEMKEKWVDPTQSNEYDSLCEIYNHEFQKHGLCYGAQGDDYEAAAVTYFKATLGAADAVGSATTQLNAWAAESQEAPSKEAIEALFPNQIQVLCSNVDGKNQLSAIRSCFAKMPSQVAVGPYNPIDCAPAAKTSAFIPCESSVPIKLLPYSPPHLRESRFLDSTPACGAKPDFTGHHIGNHPYNAASFSKNQQSLLAEVARKRIDPTQADSFDTFCEIYNHDFQKHGLCYGASGNDYGKVVVTYFNATLDVAAMHRLAAAQINSWAVEFQQAPLLAAINKLYPKKVQVLCSSVDSKNQLLIIRSCYAKQPAEGTVGPFTPIDCATVTKTNTFVLCVSGSPIKLLPYSAPV